MFAKGRAVFVFFFRPLPKTSPCLYLIFISKGHIHNLFAYKSNIRVIDMAQLGPHISISDEQLITRAFGVVDMERFEHWPDGVKKLASNLAAELFLVRYNPFIDPELVRKSVDRRLNMSRPMLDKTDRKSVV